MTTNWRNPAIVLISASMVLTLALGVRHGFGLFLSPMSLDLGWNRESFAFALALQNLVWGLSQPFVGAFADRYGPARTVAAGAVLYAAGLYAMANAATPLALSIGSGVVIGLALSCVTFSVVAGVVGRAYPPERRSLAFGIAGAAGSFGQFALLPISEGLIAALGWHGALLALGGTILLILPFALALAEKGPSAAAHGASTSAREALLEAFRTRDFWLLSFGFFVCGFQVIFIAIHLPVFLLDAGLSARVGATALALIGLFNIFGSYLAGYLGGILRKPPLLGAIYGLRSVVIVLYLLFPITPASTYLFAAAMGFLWLSTVPLTNGTVATLFGVRHLSMLSGFVFLAHQVGAFIGSWLGGYLFDRTGSYDVVWGISIALGVVALAANLPIREQPVAGLRPAA
ncbi:MAG: MFS transporter [Xanthomonadales bacterium]|nr:MFS transporter [Xanthomonadales bacterium]